MSFKLRTVNPAQGRRSRCCRWERVFQIVHTLLAAGQDVFTARLLFLSSSSATFITGAELMVDGGWRMDGGLVDVQDI